MGTQRRFERVTIVFHPSSGRGLGQRRATRLAAGLSELKVNHRLLDVSGLSNQELAENLTTSDAVVIVGGDGLIHHLVQVLAGTGIPVGIIPAGSGNDTWRMLDDGRKSQPLEIVTSFLAGEEHPHPVDLLEITFDSNPQTTRMAVGSISWGFEATVNERANTLPRWLGSLRYAMGLALCLPRITAIQTHVVGQGLEYRGPALAASIANIRSLGGGITLFAAARFDDGLADLSMVTGARIAPALRNLPRILTGREHQLRVAGQASWFSVQTAQNCYADGELLGRGSFSLKVVPGELLLMR